jgi:hypothetical protein
MFTFSEWLICRFHGARFHDPPQVLRRNDLRQLAWLIKIGSTIKYDRELGTKSFLSLVGWSDSGSMKPAQKFCRAQVV